MHILAFENKPTLFAGGQERSLHEILSGLNKHSVDISLCYAEYGELLESSYNQYCRITKCLPSRVFSTKKVVQWIRDMAICAHLVKTQNIDLLYCNQYADTPFPALIKKITQKPLIGHLRLPAPTYLSRQYRWGLNNADALIAISHHTKNTYVEQGIREDKIMVLYNAIDTNYFKIKKPQREGCSTDQKTKRVLYVGRLCPPKGIEVYIRAAKKILTQGHDISFEIIGQVRGAGVDDSYGTYLKQQAGRYLGKGISFNGHSPSVREDLQTADLVVVPSIWQEPFGRVIIEAMASGTPVVASKVGGIPEILEPDFADWLVPPNDAAQLSDSILQMIEVKANQPEKVKRMRAKVVRRFSLDRYIPQIKTIFESQFSSNNR